MANRLGSMSTDQTAQSSADATAVAQLEALATAMKLRGFGTTITTSGGKHPRVNVINKDNTHMCEDIYVAPAGDDSWWFWWSWAERIARIENVEDAAHRISYVLKPGEVLR